MISLLGLEGDGKMYIVPYIIKSIDITARERPEIALASAALVFPNCVPLFDRKMPRADVSSNGPSVSVLLRNSRQHHIFEVLTSSRKLRVSLRLQLGCCEWAATPQALLRVRGV
jgi:hypothetical protein